jgi:hypothetical protein
MRERSRSSNLRWTSALAFVAGCGRISFESLATSDGSVADTTSDTVGVGAFGTAVPLVELQNGQQLADDPMLTLDELTIVYTLEGIGTNGCDIYIATRSSISMPFGMPLALPGAINGPDCDATPALSGDQLSLLYGQSVAEFQLLESTRATTSDAWPAGQVITAVSSPAADIGPVMTADGLRLAFYSLRNGNMDLWESTRATRQSAWATPVEISELSTLNDEDSPHLSPDGLTIWFVSNAGTSFDIYTATRPALNMPFGSPSRLDELASSFDEDDPWVSSDGHRIYFARYSAANTGQIMMAAR